MFSLYIKRPPPNYHSNIIVIVVGCEENSVRLLHVYFDTTVEFDKKPEDCLLVAYFKGYVKWIRLKRVAELTVAPEAATIGGVENEDKQEGKKYNE